MANTYPRDNEAAGLLVDPDYEFRVPNYNTLVNKVYDWANRDVQALPPQIVKDGLRYAVDKAYRTPVSYTHLTLPTKA